MPAKATYFDPKPQSGLFLRIEEERSLGWFPDLRGAIPSSRRAPARLGKAVEERLLSRIVLGRLFRVPLDAEHPGRGMSSGSGTIRSIASIRPSCGPAGHCQTVAEAIDPLVVMREAGERRRLRDGGEPAPGSGCTSWIVWLSSSGTRGPASPARRGGVRAGAAERDVHDLDAAADAERRHRDPSAAWSSAISASSRSARRRRRARSSSAVPRRVDVAAADEQRPSNGSRSSSGFPSSPGQDRRPSPRAAERVEVQTRDAVPTLRPPRDAVAVEVVRDHRDRGR